MSVLLTAAPVALALGMFVKVSVLLIGAAAAQALLSRRTSAASRHLIWVLAMAGSLLIPVLAGVLPRWNVAIPVAASMAPRSAPVDLLAEPPDAPVVLSTAAGAGDSADEANLDRAAFEPGVDVVQWLMLVPIAYATVMAFLLLRLMLERASIQRLVRKAADVDDPAWTGLLADCMRRMNVRYPVRLRRSRERTMPMAAGIVRPAILIPAIADTWTEARRRAVLLHELAHVARHDCVTQLMAAIASAIYWLHPGVWWIARRLRVERELACDDRVLNAGTSGRDYAEHLLELAYTLGGGRAPALAVSMARREQLEGRLLAVLDAARNRATPAVGSTLALIAIAAALLMPLATLEGSIRPSAAAAVAVDAAAQRPDEPARAVAETPTVISTGQENLGGTWEIRSGPAESVRVQLIEDNSSHGFTVAVEHLEGLSPALMTGRGGPAQFSVRRDAGTFAFGGAFWNGIGAGTYRFTPSASFRDELVKRGFGRPTAGDLHALARSDVGFAFLDEVKSQGYAPPGLSDLARAANHGITIDYLREMGRAGYRLGRLEGLITLRDHGVSADFIRELGTRGLTGLTPVDLVRARDHGVNAKYIDELQGLGYRELSLDSLISARDHGVSAEYARDLRALGSTLTLVELTTARDHGVNGDYIRELAALGYGVLSLSDLITARDHGVSPEYVRELRALGYRLTLAGLTAARDHGVEKDYLTRFAALGYEKLPLDTVMQLRDHGVTPEYVTQLKTLGHDRLDPEALIRMRDQGVGSPVTAERLRAGARRFLEMLMRYTQ